jgi:hypothetical protein
MHVPLPWQPASLVQDRVLSLLQTLASSQPTLVLLLHLLWHCGSEVHFTELPLLQTPINRLQVP